MFTSPSTGWRIKPLLNLVYLELAKYQIMYMQSHNKKMSLVTLNFVVFFVSHFIYSFIKSGYW